MLQQTTAVACMLPFLPLDYERTTQLTGAEYWPYGLEANRHVLNTFLRHHHEQGRSPRHLAPEELYTAQTVEFFAI
jgi:4,5-dihydroxyphthalate decarboxylase